MSRISRISRLISDDDGQDLVEYALLCGLVGAVGVLVLPEIGAKMSDAYADWVSSASDAWEPCPPAPAACP
jgi:Flp pilus assembly pilin Flp